jgi:arylsulfatase A-like enzyme
MRENVLVVVFDTARADVFEPYGGEPGSTPAVADLARRGLALPRMYATASWTLPSHASMFTGLLPRSLGLGQAPGGGLHGSRPVLEAQRDRLLPEVLRRAGYATGAISANLWVSEASGFATGFERFEVVGTSERQDHLERDDLRGRLAWAIEGLRARADDGAAAAERTLREWLAEPLDRPFFWFVNLVECHSPYLPPKPYNDLGPLARVRAADEARRHLSLGEIWRACVGELDVPAAALERMRHLYRRSIRSLDDWLARVLDALDARGVLDETTVFVTSDHGENFGEGGLLAHAFSLDDRLVRVPFVVSRAGGIAEPEGVHSLAELPAMVAAAAGLEDHPWRERSLPAGLAAAQFDPPAPEGDPRVDVAVREWSLDAEARRRLTSPITCVTDGRFKLVRRGDHDELYDLVHDPLEVRPVVPYAASAELRAALEDERLWEEPRAAPAVAALPEPEPGELAEIERSMKLLGYM